MKLILISIICGFLGFILGLSIGQTDGSGVILFGEIFGVIGFFSPGLYVLNKLYDNAKKEKIKE